MSFLTSFLRRDTALISYDLFQGKGSFTKNLFQSPFDKAMEGGGKRTDGDYGLAWIRREGKGRVFYQAQGHSERVYAMRPMLEHILAGIQYALGDLKADDKPSVKRK